MYDWLILTICAASTVLIFMVLLVLGLCQAASRTDDYLEQKEWEARHETHQN